jgi:O-antigen ligase
MCCLFFVEKNNLIVQRFLDLKLTDETIQQRGLLINQAVSMVNKNPIFGVGLGNYINNLGSAFISYDQLQPVHNIFLLILAETGLIGFGVFMILAKKIFANIRNIYFLMLVVNLFIIGCFDHYLLTLQQGQILLVLALSMIMSKRG